MFVASNPKCGFCETNDCNHGQYNITFFGIGNVTGSSADAYKYRVQNAYVQLLQHANSKGHRPRDMSVFLKLTNLGIDAHYAQASTDVELSDDATTLSERIMSQLDDAVVGVADPWPRLLQNKTTVWLGVETSHDIPPDPLPGAVFC